MGIEHEIQRTVWGHKAGAKDLAEKLGRAESTVYGWANPNTENKMPVLQLLPLMKATNDYRILRWLAKKTGHVVIKLRKRLGTHTDISTVFGLSSQFAETSQVLHSGMQGKAKKQECLDTLYDTIEASQKAIRMIEKHGFIPVDRSQLCLPIED